MFGFQTFGPWKFGRNGLDFERTEWPKCPKFVLENMMLNRFGTGFVLENMTYLSTNTSEIWKNQFGTGLVRFRAGTEQFFWGCLKPERLVGLGPLICSKPNVWNRNYLIRISDVVRNPNNLTTEPNQKAPKSECLVSDVYCTVECRNLNIRFSDSAKIRTKGCSN